MAEPLETFLRVRLRLNTVREESGWIFAHAEIGSLEDTLRSDLSVLQDEGVIAEIHQNGVLVFSDNLQAGRADLKVDTGLLTGFFETYDSLVSKYPVNPPEWFTVWHKDARTEDGCRVAWTLLHFLHDKVEVWDETQMRFFLVDQHAIEVPLHYSAASTLDLMPLVPRIERFLDDAHLDADARWAFFRKSSSRLLRDVLAYERLNCFFENLNQVFTRTEQDHSLYLERFSFEDLLKTFDEKRLKFVADLNLVLAGLQTATIAVPVAFFLIAEKFKPADRLVGQNVILGAGGLIFCALLFVFSMNQGLTLKELGKSLSDFEVEQLRKQSERSGRLKALLKGTWSHYRKVRSLLWAVRILLICFAVMLAGTLAWCSLPDFQKEWPYQASTPAPLWPTPSPSPGKPPPPHQATSGRRP